MQFFSQIFHRGKRKRLLGVFRFAQNSGWSKWIWCGKHFCWIKKLKHKQLLS